MGIQLYPRDETSDRQLVNRLRQSDVAAFDAIVYLYNDALEDYARRITHDDDLTQDVVQDVFVRLWELRETLEIQSTLQSYLYGGIRNRAISALRHRQVQERCVTDFLTESMTPGLGVKFVSPDVAMERQELADALALALNSLSLRVRQVALLRWRDKLSRAEIAAVLGVAVPTVNNQLTAAAKALRPLLHSHRSEQNE